MGYTDGGESVSIRVQRADAKEVSCSAHKINLGGHVVVALDGGKSFVQGKLADEEEVQEETEKVLKGNRFAKI